MASTPLQLVLVCFAAREEEGGDACLDAGEGWPPTLGQRNEEKGGPFSPSHGPSHQTSLLPLDPASCQALPLRPPLLSMCCWRAHCPRFFMR